MHLINPFPNAGLRRLDTSSEPPDAEPAPIIVCISSINSIGLSLVSKKLRTSLIRFSKSPLYLVPATRAAMSKEYIVELAIILGTLLL